MVSSNAICGKRSRRFRRRQLLDRHVERAQRGHRRAAERVVGAEHPERAGRPEEPALPSGVVRAPQLERPHRHFRVNRPRAVGRADDAGLTAGARPRVARPPRVDERHARAAAAQLERGPAAEGPGANDHDVRPSAGLRDTLAPGGGANHRQQDRRFECTSRRVGTRRSYAVTQIEVAKEGEGVEGA